MTMQEQILSQFIGMKFDELTKAEKNILEILKKNGISWSIDDNGEVQKGTKKKK